MQKFSEFVNEHKLQLENSKKETNASKFNQLFEDKLKEYGVKSPVELSENDSKKFYGYLQSLKEEEISKPAPYMYSPVGFSCAVCKLQSYNKDEAKYTCASPNYQKHMGTHFLINPEKYFLQLVQ